MVKLLYKYSKWIMYISRSFLILPCQVSFMMQSQIPYDFARILWRLFSFSCRSLAALICILHYKSNQPKNKLREKNNCLYDIRVFGPPKFSASIIFVAKKKPPPSPCRRLRWWQVGPNWKTHTRKRLWVCMMDYSNN